jgi:hypothetical protein
MPTKEKWSAIISTQNGSALGRGLSGSLQSLCGAPRDMAQVGMKQVRDCSQSTLSNAKPLLCALNTNADELRISRSTAMPRLARVSRHICFEKHTFVYANCLNQCSEQFAVTVNCQLHQPSVHR